MQKITLIGLAGLLGTLARYFLSAIIAQRFGETFPTGTILVNVVGCFLAGFLFCLIHERFPVNEILGTAIMVGFLGGFTTFSSFALQTLTLFQGGQLGLATINFLLSNVVGLFMCWAGYSIGRLVRI